MKSIQRPEHFRRHAEGLPLKLQTTFTCRISQRLDATVIFVSATIKRHLFDPLFNGPLRNLPTDLLSSRHISPMLGPGAE